MLDLDEAPGTDVAKNKWFRSNTPLQKDFFLVCLMLLTRNAAHRLDSPHLAFFYLARLPSEGEPH